MLLDKNHYYVYAIHCDGILVYIGKGKGARAFHGVSGKSHNYLLNELHFKHNLLGEPKPQVEIILVTPFEVVALQEEQRFIKIHQPMCNTAGKKSSRYKGDVYLAKSSTSDLMFEEDVYEETEALHVQVEPDTCSVKFKAIKSPN